MNNKLLTYAGIIVGIILVGLAFYYFSTPADRLPHFLPGYSAIILRSHFKHGLASLLLACAFFAFAWFNSGKKTEAS